MGRAFQIVILILAVSVTMNCQRPPDPRAQQLYDLATLYYDRNEYQRGVEILQRITIEFADSDLAKTAEAEIPDYKKLEKLLIENKRRDMLSKYYSLARALENYNSRYLSYPLSTADLEKLPASFVTDLTDSWSHPIHYKPTYSSESVPRHAPDGYVLASFGKDGLPGGTGPDKDSFFTAGEEKGQFLFSEDQ